MSAKENIIVIIDDAEGEFNKIKKCIESNSVYSVSSYESSCLLRENLYEDFCGTTFIKWIKDMKTDYNIAAIMIDIEFLPIGDDKSGLKLLNFFRNQYTLEKEDDQNFYQNTPLYIISKYDTPSMKAEAHGSEYLPNAFISKNGDELCEGKMINKVISDIKVFSQELRVKNIYVTVEEGGAYIEEHKGNIIGK